MLKLVLFGAYGCTLLYHIQSKKGKMDLLRAHDGVLSGKAISAGGTGN
jgi:hypothetical protein